MNNLGNKLKEYREKAGLTQQQVADYLMVSKGAVGHWENNKRIANIIIIEKLAHLYNTTASEIIDNENLNITQKEPFNLLDKIILDLGSEGYFNNEKGFEDLDKHHQQILIGALNSHIKKLMEQPLEY